MPRDPACGTRPRCLEAPGCQRADKGTIARRGSVTWSLGAIAFALSLAAAAPLQGGEALPSSEAVVAALERGPGPTKGEASAPLTIVEFSDFQCSFCRRFWRETLPRIEERYIRTGKVRFVYRHLAILGPPSVQAAEAAECAQAQGRFWPYHDRLFEGPGPGPLTFTVTRLKGYARDVGLDGEDFDRCLMAGTFRQKVRNETMVGQFIGGRGTPTFLINGKLLVGAQPFEVFETAIEEELRTPPSERRR